MNPTTTASSTHASPNDDRLDPSRYAERLRRALALVWIALCLFVAPSVWSQGIDVHSARVELTDDGWIGEADFSLAITPLLQDAVERGVALYFVVEADIRRPRWYWWDEGIAVEPLTLRLSYNALTRQYRVQVGAAGLAQRFDNLTDALLSIGRVRDWRLGDRNLLQKGERYSIAMRMRLDVTQLPKPFQLNAITNREWSLSSDWARFGVAP